MRKDEKYFKPISLLPAKQRREILILKIMKFIVTFTSLILVVASIFFVITPLLNLSKNDQITKVDDQIAVIRSEIKGMQQYEEVYNKNRSYIDIITKAMGTVPQWDEILKVLITSKPLTIQIKGVEQLADAKSSTASSVSSANTNANSNTSTQTSPETIKTNAGGNLVIKCVVLNLNDLDYWIKELKKINPIFSGLTAGKFAGNQYGYDVELTLPVTDSPPYVIDLGGNAK